MYSDRPMPSPDTIHGHQHHGLISWERNDWGACAGTFVEVVAHGVDLLDGPLAESVAPHLVKHLVHLPSSAFPRPSSQLRAPSNGFDVGSPKSGEMG